MSLTVIQAGANLQLINEAGVLTAPLTMPAGITLRTDIPPRWVVYEHYVVLVNTPSQPLIIDALGVVRILSPKAPRLAPILAGAAGGTLSGTYGGVRYTFVTLDTAGNVISESDFSPPSNTVTISSQFLKVTGLDVSPDTISLRRLYRPTSGGAVLFQWLDLNGNVLTSVQDDLSDVGLVLQAAPILGTPPRLTTIAEFRGRLWGVGDIDIDHVRYTEAGLRYAWPSDNLIEIPAVGSDEFGVVALIARREALGCGRRNMLVQITGSGAETLDSLGNSVGIDFTAVILSKELGVESQESAQVFRDEAFFLWKNGVYRWGSDGIICVSDGTADGKGNVRSWFITDSYFNRDMFPFAFAVIDPDRPVYRLFLASAGSTVIDSWIEYDIANNTWWGPHSTTLFSPLSAFQRTNAADRALAVIGGATAVYNDQALRTDGASTGIAFDVIGKRHAMQVPDQDKYFGEVSVLGTAQPAGTLSVISRTGDLSQTQILTQYMDLKRTRQRLGRLGRGRHAQLEFTNNQAGVDVALFGYEIDPVNLIGRR